MDITLKDEQKEACTSDKENDSTELSCLILPGDSNEATI